MPIGWAKADPDTVDALESAQEADTLNVNFMTQPLTVIEVGDVDPMSSGGDVKLIICESHYGGLHQLVLWRQAAIHNRNWDYAITNRRWRKKDETWQNNTDKFRLARMESKANSYEITVRCFDSCTVQAENDEEAIEKAMSVFRRAGHDVKIHQVIEGRVIASITFTKTIRVQSEEEARQKIKGKGSFNDCSIRKCELTS